MFELVWKLVFILQIVSVKALKIVKYSEVSQRSKLALYISIIPALYFLVGAFVIGLLSVSEMEYKQLSTGISLYFNSVAISFMIAPIGHLISGGIFATKWLQHDKNATKTDRRIYVVALLFNALMFVILCLVFLGGLIFIVVGE